MNRIARLIVVAALLLPAACTRNVQQQTDVGAVLGLTGENAKYGQLMQRGYSLALDEINAPNSDVKPLHLVIEDSQFDSAKAVSAYRKITGAQGIRLLVGITGSRNAIPVCEASKKDDVLILDPLGSAPKLTTVGGPNYFRIMASDAFAGQYNVDWAMQNGMKRPAIVYVEDDWGTSYRDAVQHYLASKGFDSPLAIGVIAGSRDFRTEVKKLWDYHPDTIFLLVYAKEGAALMKQMQEVGLSAMVYGSDNISSADFVSAGPGFVEGVRVAMPAETRGAEFDTFAARYRAKYGEEPDANVIKSYDAMKLLAAAIGRVGPAPAHLRAYLRSPEFSYQGLSGTIKFDEHGDLVGQQYTRMVYKSGKLVPFSQGTH
jgi:branched-chain amino acid transport system substrate-binding protein